MLRYHCFHSGCGPAGPFGHTHLTGLGFTLATMGVVTVGLVALGLAIGAWM